MKRRAAAGWGVSVALGLASVAAFASCKSSGPAAATTSGGACSLNSDCNNPLVCVFAKCHVACSNSGDCSPGERCVPSDVDGGAAAAVCQLPAEQQCASGSDCVAGEVCGADQQCRPTCKSSSDCLGMQACVTNDGMGACYDTNNPIDKADGIGDAAVNKDDGAVSLVADSAAPPTDGGPDGVAPDATSDGGGSDASPDAPVTDSATGDGHAAEGGGDAAFVPDAASGALGFTVSNVPAAALGSFAAGADGGDAGPPDVTVSASCSDCLGTPTSITMAGDTSADLFVVHSLTVAQGASVRLNDVQAVIIVSLTTVNVAGQILVNGESVVGAGSFPIAGPGGFTGADLGPGAGQAGFSPANTFSNSGGGSFCGVGGRGGLVPPDAGGSGTAASGGTTYGSAGLMPLVGGSAGGTTGNVSCGVSSVGGVGVGGGGGGGAIQIVAASTITIGAFGGINASGGGGAIGGGGRGGAILLEAPTVAIYGTLAANGGAGGGGCGLWGASGSENDQPAVGYDVIGGSGAAGTTINGSDGAWSGSITNTNANPNEDTGGGGGGAGRIHINTASGSATIDDGAGGTTNVSPALSTACATQGPLTP